MTTFEEAQQALVDHLDGAWGGPGELMAAPFGQEDARGFALTAGAKEYLVDGNSDFARMDDTIYFVSKADGAVEESSFMAAPTAIRLAAMEYVGDVPAELQ